MGSGDAQDAQIAGAALAVALAALAIAIAQLCGQMFATADGYRRCQPSVMGAWARHTRLRWKWSEMRFETLFTTPEITLEFFEFDREISSEGPDYHPWLDLEKLENTKYVSDYPKSGPFKRISAEVIGNWRHKRLLNAKLVDSNLGAGSHHEMACWIPFLQHIKENESEIISAFPRSDTVPITRVTCRPVQKSWDFMAPDLVRPLAVTYVGDIAIIVQRLGMEWQTFRPEEGEMRAEGQGHIIYSTLVRSVGPVLHYAHENSAHRPNSNFHRAISRPTLPNPPTFRVDALRFGILLGDMLMPDDTFILKMGTIKEVLETLDILDRTGSASKRIRDNRRLDSTSTFGFSDVISMAAPSLRELGGSRCCLPPPTEHYAGLTTHKEGFVVFRHRLGDYVSKNRGNCSHATWVLETYDSLKALHACWENGIDDNNPSDCIHVLDEIRDAWDHTGLFFCDIRTITGLKAEWLYPRLIGCHIKHAVNYWHESHQRIRDKRTRDHYGLTNWLAEGMHLYWDYLPDIANEMSLEVKRHKVSGEAEVSDSFIGEAWIMLMFRAFCWSRCHYMGPEHGRSPESSRIPSRYWNSKLPVWIG